MVVAQLQSQRVFALQHSPAAGADRQRALVAPGDAAPRQVPHRAERAAGTVPDRLFNQVAVNTIWIHAVSVGEVLAISRVVEELKAQLPGWRIVVSTTTDTGQKLARERFGKNNVFYVPLDLPFAVRAYLQALRPRLLVLAESEFWPNLLHWARLSGAAVAVVNARVSDRSLPGYLRFHKLLRRVMQNVQLFLVQSDEDARRLIQMGAPEERVHVSGNLKFEVKPPAKPAILAQLKFAIEKEEIGPVLVAGSTLEGEEAMLLETFRQIASQYQARSWCLRRGILSASRRSHLCSHRRAFVISGARSGTGSRRSPEVSSCSTRIGELASLYELVDLAFIGGSLVPRGGHNVLEVAQFGAPILVGAHTENFRDIIDLFRRADALRVVTPQSLTANRPDSLLENHDEQDRWDAAPLT